jgi:hypothetical protein
MHQHHQQVLEIRKDRVVQMILLLLVNLDHLAAQESPFARLVLQVRQHLIVREHLIPP